MAALASNWLRHFRLLLWIHWTEYSETWQEARTRHPLPSLCFWSRSEIQRWPTRPLFGRGIFDFSETADGNLPELDRLHELSFFYQVCVFRADRKNKMVARPLICWHFLLFFWYRWTEFARKQQLNVFYQVCGLSGRSENLDCRPGLWLAETFSTSSLKPLKGISRNLTGSRKSTSSIKFEFFGPIGKLRFAPCLW